MVVDLFAGSGNTLSWIQRHTGARRAIGFELDDAVFELASTNLRIAGLSIDLRHDSYQHGLQELGQPGEDLLIVFVSPPWGHALREGSELDLRRTQPPVAQAIDVTHCRHRPPQAAVRDPRLPDRRARLTGRTDRPVPVVGDEGL